MYIFRLSRYYFWSTLAGFIVLNLLCINQGIACSEIVLNYQNQPIIARNFDWPTKYSFVVINPRGIVNRNNLSYGGKHLEWVSHYGSATMNLVDKNGRVLVAAVMGGFNEYGFAASHLWLDKSVYSQNPSKPTIGSGLWVKYLLDNVKTVDEAIKLTDKADVVLMDFNGKQVTVHLFIHDASGDSAIMEYLKGKLVIHHNKHLSVLTNDVYAEAMQNLNQYKNFGGQLPLLGGYESAERFVNAALFIKKINDFASKEQAVAYGFEALGYVAEPPNTPTPTVWSSVIDCVNKVLYFRDIDNQQIRYLNLNHFDLSKGQKIKILSINNNLSGDVEKAFWPLINK